MTNGKTVLESVIPAVSKSNGDYYGKDGLLYCGKCHTPKEAFFAKNFVLMGKNRHPVDCRCRKMEREQQEVAIRQQKHNELVRRLKAGGFSDTAMLDWNFENDDGRAPQMHYAHRYVEQWQTICAENLGLLLGYGDGTHGARPHRFIFQIPSGKREEERYYKGGNRGDFDPCRFLCRLSKACCTFVSSASAMATLWLLTMTATASIARTAALHLSETAYLRYAIQRMLQTI